MFANLVKKVTFTCPNCNTSIKFDVLPGNDEIQDLYSVAENLECPKCKESLSNSATEMVRAILDYNKAVTILSALEKCMDSKLD